MTIILNNIALPIEEDKRYAVEKALRQLALPADAVLSADICKTSVDARRGKVQFVCSVQVKLTEQGALLLTRNKELQYTIRTEKPLTARYGTTPLQNRPVVVGFGPAGMFAALLLAQHGYHPIVLERGSDMDRRTTAVEHFWRTGVLSPDCNVQFGEGGAGAFSDGKLTTRINDPLCSYVLDTLVEHGAPAEIKLLAKPHIGTDLLRDVVKSIRQDAVGRGAQLCFDRTVRSFSVRDGALRQIDDLAAQAAIVAVGHSARDTFGAMARCGLTLTPKPFSVGVRIEHLQSDIDRALYRSYAGHPNLPVGEYQLSHREGTRAAYTFCMCPGGQVVAAASAHGQVVTNGMSYHARNEQNANSALVVSVSPDDFGQSWQDSIEFQRRLEHAAFLAGGGGFAAPFCTVGELLGTGKGSLLTPSYPLGVREYPLAELLPAQVSGMMKRSLSVLGRKLEGFDAPKALLTGVETRTSSPIRVLRGEDYAAVGARGLYPCGEGAGYAGGIMSAAVDGLRCALALMERYAPPKAEGK